MNNYSVPYRRQSVCFAKNLIGFLVRLSTCCLPTVCSGQLSLLSFAGEEMSSSLRATG